MFDHVKFGVSDDAAFAIGPAGHDIEAVCHKPEALPVVAADAPRAGAPRAIRCPSRRAIVILNRSVLIARPRQPYLEWAVSLDDSGLAPDPADEQAVYLVPIFEGDDDAENILQMVSAEVFERELGAWHTDEADWPKNRTLAMLRMWFQIEFHSIVDYLCAYEFANDEA